MGEIDHKLGERVDYLFDGKTCQKKKKLKKEGGLRRSGSKMGSNFNRMVPINCPEKGMLSKGFDEVRG